MADPQAATREAPADLLVLGASGKVGRLLRANWPQTPCRTLWQGRSMGAAPGWVRWDPPAPLPAARVALILASCTENAPAALEINAGIARDVARAALRAGTQHLILASSMAVYGLTPPEGATEATPPAPIRPYGLAKRAMEEALVEEVAIAGEDRPGVTLLRMGNVVGADLLGAIASTDAPVTLDRFEGGGGPVRSYLGARYLARVVLELVERARAGLALPACLNVAAPAPVEMGALLRAAGIGFAWRPAPPDALASATMDCTRVATLVPPQPDEVSVEGMIADWRRGSAA